MATITSPREWTLAGLLAEFGPIAASRIRTSPAPGNATEDDVVAMEDREDRLYELFDGVLVEKVMEFYESYLAMLLGHRLTGFAAEHNLGIVAGPDGTIRLATDQVRIPDVAFISWKQLPQGQIPTESIPSLIPELAVEIISKGNTRKEMQRKLDDYFRAGVRLVWYVYPQEKAVEVYTSAAESARLSGKAVLDGGHVLPGFELPLAVLFAKPPAEVNDPATRS